MDIESLVAENSALKRKLQSKAEALFILNEELIRVKKEREEIKYNGQIESPLYSENGDVTKCSGCRQLAEHKQLNKRLVYQLEDLKDRLNVAEGDIEVLRRERKCSTGRREGGWHGRDALVASLEEATAKAKQLESDLATVLDEKMELVAERDSLRSRVHRLSHQINRTLNAPSHIDVDSLIMENKYLQERLDQSIADKEILQQSIAKYKGMLDKRRNKGAVQLGTSASCEGMVVSHKQVQELLEGGKMLNNEATLADLRALCLALLESLQDKSLALAHHKKTNKALAGRIADLEAILSKDMSRPLFPSRILMEGYSTSNIDKDVEQLLKKDPCDDSDDSSIRLHEDLKSSKNIDSDQGDQVNSGDSFLPPDLQDLVIKALQEIKKDNELSEIK